LGGAVGQAAAELDEELLQLRHASIIKTNCPHRKEPKLNCVRVIEGLGKLVVEKNAAHLQDDS
jgi:hypothetical protein